MLLVPFNSDRRTRWLIPFFFYFYGDRRDLHSFPTRRSSDLGGVRRGGPDGAGRGGDRPAAVPAGRSEEHTSELQSRPHLVCRLLLEKKKREHGGGPSLHLSLAFGCDDCCWSSVRRYTSCNGQ